MKSFVDFLDVIIKTGTYNKDCKLKGIYSVVCKKKKRKKEFWNRSLTITSYFVFVEVRFMKNRENAIL